MTGKQPRSVSEQFAIVPEVVLDSPISAGAKVLYAVLRRYANSVGEAWPSKATLEKRLGASSSSVKRWMAELTESGFVEVVERSAESGRQRSNLYRFPTLARGPRMTAQAGDNPVGQVMDGPLGGSTDGPQNESQMNETVTKSYDLLTEVVPPSEEVVKLVLASVWGRLTTKGVRRDVAKGQAYGMRSECVRLLTDFPEAPVPMLVGALLGEDSRNLHLYRRRDQPPVGPDGRADLRVVASDE